MFTLAKRAIPFALGFICLWRHIDGKKNTYDFIVVGGGTAGLAVACRLSEKSVKVLVLEAGGAGHGNTGISIPGKAGSTFKTEVDWNYSTVSQDNVNGRIIDTPRGRVLGGTSAINFMINTKSSKEDYNAIEALGNTDWNWHTFDAASKKSERLNIRPKTANYNYVPKFHGRAGKVTSNFPIDKPDQLGPYFVAVNSLGTYITKDAFGGNITGAWIYPYAISENATRVTSATAYYDEYVAKRENLEVETDAEVIKLISEKRENKVVVTAVQYKKEKKLITVHATKEIILCAGTYGTPSILERSGFGEQERLKKYNIDVKVNLPGIGNNLADHVVAPSIYRLKSGVLSSGQINQNKTFEAEQIKLYETKRRGVLANFWSLFDYEPLSKLLTPSEIDEGLRILSQNNHTLSQEAFEQVYKLLTVGNPIEFFIVDTLFDAQFKPEPNTSYFTIITCLQYPLSRGSVHIQSSNFEKPLIDPKYLSHPFDLWLLTKATAYARRIMGQPAWNMTIKDEVFPGPQVKTESDLIKSVRSGLNSQHHPIGTASMLPRKQNGVVDSHLRVYGVERLRIADASVIPLHLANHIAFTIYAIAERAVEIILADHQIN